jgi:predicted nucleotidyltransferase
VDGEPQSSPLVAKAAAILREEGATEVYVFGSWARGTARPDSDLDLAVSGLPPERYFKAAARVSAETGRMADILEIEREPTFVAFLRSRGELRRVA